MHYQKRSGQALLLSVMVIGGVLIGASAIAGVLMTYQVRQTNDVVNSMKAFYAADAGVEWETYNVNVPAPFPSFSNDISATSSWVIDGTDVIVQSQGFSRGAVRALESRVTEATALPALRPAITVFAVSGNTSLVNDPCSGSCTYRTGNPDLAAPITPPATLTIAWASERTDMCAGYSVPAGIWSTNELSGSQTIDIGGRTPPITLSLECARQGVSVSSSTVIRVVQ